MKLSKNSNYELRSYIYKVILQLVCEIISFENVIRGFRSRNEHHVMCLYYNIYNNIFAFRPLAGVWMSAIACQHRCLCAVSSSGER